MELGEKIEKLRLEKNLSRQELCQDETELSIRQLARIEKGESKPTLSKLNYIAERLGIESYKLMPDYKELNNHYLELKYFLLRTPVYNNPEIVKQKEAIYDEISEKYYDDLPEEEQLVIDSMQAYLDVTYFDDVMSANNILDDYFAQIKIKKEYSLNDILLLNLYFIRIIREEKISEEESQEFYLLADKVIGQVENFKVEDAFVLINNLLMIIGISEILKDFTRYEEIFEKIDYLLVKTKVIQEKPVVNIWKWRYYLSRDYEKAESFYKEAVNIATLINNLYLAERLEEQWQADLKVYRNLEN